MITAAPAKALKIAPSRPKASVAAVPVARMFVGYTWAHSEYMMHCTVVTNSPCTPEPEYQEVRALRRVHPLQNEGARGTSRTARASGQRDPYRVIATAQSKAPHTPPRL